MQILSRLSFFLFLIVFVAIVCPAEETCLIADRGSNTVYNYSAESGLTGVLVTNQMHLWGVALDGQTDEVYWSELDSGSIWKRPLSGGSNTVVYSSSNAVLRGLTIDYDSRKLYFLDSEDGTLNSLTLGSTNVLTLRSGFRRPNDLALDAENQLIYVADSGDDLVGCYNLTGAYHTVIQGTEMDGVWGLDLSGSNTLYLSDFRSNVIYKLTLADTNLTTLVSGQETPRGICVDKHHDRLYWVEAESNILWTASLGGSNVTAVYTNTSGHFRSLICFEDEDKDGDFLSDDWERHYIGNLLENGTDDTDGDGLDNFAEAAFVSSPNDGSELPTGTTLTPGSGGVTLTYDWRTDPWYSYTLEHSADLQTWDPVSVVTNEFAIDLGSNRVHRSLWVDEGLNGISAPHFFRLRVER